MTHSTMQNIKFTEEDWQRHEQNWIAWWNQELNRPLVMIEIPHLYSEKKEFSRKFILELPIAEMLDYYQSRLRETCFFGDAWPRWVPNFGPGIMAGFLGAKVKCDENGGKIWYEPEQIVPLSEMELHYDPHNIWWRRIYNLTREACNRWGNSVNLAHTNFACNLDILASLYSDEKLLIALSREPEEISRLLLQITALWKKYYTVLYEVVRNNGRGTSYWAAIWSPQRCGMLQSDFSYMISPAMFERLVMPDLSQLCDFLDHPFYHLDGVGQIGHLDMLLSMKKLLGIQWIPGEGQPPPEEWLDLLHRIRKAGKLCQLYVSAKGALKIIRELGGSGFAFYILDDFTHYEAEEFLRLIKNELSF